MSYLWESSQISKSTSGQASCEFQIAKIVTDHRDAKDGCLFVALPGSHMDGHDFVQGAFENGAVGAIVRKNYHGKDSQNFIYVDDTKTALDQIAKTSRKRMKKSKVIAVTGSVGKTSIKEALLFVLDAFGKSEANPASYNNHVGVPLTLANFSPDLDYAILELGMNHAGEISGLASLAEPNIAIITCIAPSHLGNFENIQEIADAKSEIFENLAKKGMIILNHDDEYFDHLTQKAQEKAPDHKVYSFGTTPNANAYIIEQNESHIHASIMGEKVYYTLSIEGAHWALNSVCILLALKLMKIDLKSAAEKLKDFQAIKGRGKTQNIPFEKGSFLLIDDSYNANPTSMQAGLQVLGQKKGRKIAVLGDMLELGDSGPKYHRALLQELLDAQVDKVYACGPLMNLLFEMLPPGMKGVWREKSQELLPDFLAQIEDGDVIFVKGSKGSRMGLIVYELEALKIKEK